MADLLIYPLDDLALPWGLTLAEAAARLQHRPSLPPHGGWPNLRVACRSVFGLAATEANLRAPALHKPIMQVSYKLAAPTHFWGRPQEAAQWQQPLTDLLGVPAQTQAYTEPWRTGWSNVVYTARWQVGLVQVGLSVFGGVRQQASGPAAAGLYLDWQDELTAAQPFLAAAESEAAALGAVAGQATAPLVYKLQQRQTPYHLPRYDAPTPGPGREATQLRQAQRALYREGLYETPTRFQTQLSDHEVALWAVPGRSAWAVSTQFDTVLLTPDTPLELVILHPAKGGGNHQLRLGDLSLGDAYDAPALLALAAAIARHTGRPVPRVDDNDC
jgi:hypothetical protein